MTFFTKKIITFSKVKGLYKYHFQMFKGLELRVQSHVRARLEAYFKFFFITKYNTIVSIFLYVFIGIIKYKQFFFYYI